jgi:hypothetical protein
MNYDYLKDILIPTCSALLGGCIAGFFALFAVRMTHKYDLKLAKAEGTKQVDGVLLAIQAELQILESEYAARSGRILEGLPDGRTFDVFFSLTQQYFIVYPNNSAIVGQIDDDALVTSIVTTYNLGNFLIEQFRINNWYLQLQVDNHRMANTDTFQPNRVQHAKMLKQAHKDLHRATEELLQMIKKYRTTHLVK